jgi:hypothetical protein
MDVSVSHLNNRLALQLPAQLPLGLVFVLGVVESLDEKRNARSETPQFDLVESEHQVRCQLSERAAAEVSLVEGMRVRAGGHLVFDPKRVNYYLLVRDVEVVDVPDSNPLALNPIVERSELASVLDEVRNRADSAKLAEGDMPLWVKRLAPPEFRAKDVEGIEDETAVVPETARPDPDMEAVAALSAAMDSPEDVELTDSLLVVAQKLNQARWGLSQGSSANGAPKVSQNDYRYVPDIEDPDAYPPTGRRSADRILLLIIIIGLILFLVIMLAFITGAV